MAENIKQSIKFRNLQLVSLFTFGLKVCVCLIRRQLSIRFISEPRHSVVSKTVTPNIRHSLLPSWLKGELCWCDYYESNTTDVEHTKNKTYAYSHCFSVIGQPLYGWNTADTALNKILTNQAFTRENLEWYGKIHANHMTKRPLNTFAWYKSPVNEKEVTLDIQWPFSQNQNEVHVI